MGGTLTFTTSGSYTIQLRVTDNNGRSVTTSRTLNILSTTPIASISLLATVFVGTPVVI